MTNFFYYRQNNSYGEFTIDRAEGIATNVFIEAEDAAEANSIALKIGIYFNGVSDGIDCPCCGDRWHEAYDSAKYTSLDELEDYGGSIAIHYKNRSFEWRE